MNHTFFWLGKILRNETRDVHEIDVFVLIKLLDKNLVKWEELNSSEQQLIIDFYQDSDFQPKADWVKKDKDTNYLYKAQIFSVLFDRIADEVSQIVKSLKGQEPDTKSEEFNKLVRLKFFAETGKYPEMYLIDLLN